MLRSIIPVLLLLIETSAASLGKYARVVGAEIAANTKYNFIVIGGGIGGLTVADRLTEDPKGKFLTPTQ